MDIKKIIKSPICDSNASFYCTKKGYDYYQCISTKTLFCDTKLDQNNMVGGTGEEERNTKHNKSRISMILDIMKNPQVVDFGCGHGSFVTAMKQSGINAFGYDKFNEKFNTLPKGNTDIVTMIEVVEHLAHPFEEFKLVYDNLKNGGYLFIETSFSDWVNEQHPYLDPQIGHQTIFSHHGLDVLLQSFKFKPYNHLNNNIRIYKKT